MDDGVSHAEWACQPFLYSRMTSRKTIHAASHTFSGDKQSLPSLSKLARPYFCFTAMAEISILALLTSAAA